MKRPFDIAMALILLAIFALPLLILFILVRFTSRGPALYWSDRVGKNNVIFRMAKLRTMKVDVPVVATHLLADPKSQLTPIGGFLRKSSLDEIPQLWNILIGDMSFVGPRPALFNQDDLIHLRTNAGIDQLIPGLTGWAQINGWRGNTSLEKRIEYDLYYIKNWSLLFDFKIILLTVFKGLVNRNAY